jgi:chemotaxis signal transduction protein
MQRPLGSELFGIECVAAGERVVVPADAIEQIVEYAVSPLPLSRKEIAGLGVLGDELVLSVSLRENAAARPQRGERSTKAVLLTTRREGGARWAVEIDDVLSFVRVREEEGAGRTAWLPRGRTFDGRAVLCVDVEEMIAELGGEAAR